MAAAIGVAGFSSEESSDENPLDDQPSTSSSQPQANSAAVQCSLYEPPAKRCLLDNSLFNAALDRTKISTWQAMMTVTPALACFIISGWVAPEGGNIFLFSPST